MQEIRTKLDSWSQSWQPWKTRKRQTADRTPVEAGCHDEEHTCLHTGVRQHVDVKCVCCTAGCLLIKDRMSSFSRGHGNVRARGRLSRFQHPRCLT